MSDESNDANYEMVTIEVDMFELAHQVLPIAEDGLADPLASDTEQDLLLIIKALASGVLRLEALADVASDAGLSPEDVIDLILRAN